ncbi:hypothetical protein CIB48_g1520 [Xylaria polymorpha]|nr:hypothetical protein CIB48_g1520 [Xylaria polymorpha]
MFNTDYSFDAEIEKFDLSTLCNPGEEVISYIYFADRLEELFQELQSPRPRTWLEKQMQRRSGGRHMMLATLIGVAFAVLLGILALILSSVQTWIAYQAWKHPVEYMYVGVRPMRNAPEGCSQDVDYPEPLYVSYS